MDIINKLFTNLEQERKEFLPDQGREGKGAVKYGKQRKKKNPVEKT